VGGAIGRKLPDTGENQEKTGNRQEKAQENPQKQNGTGRANTSLGPAFEKTSQNQKVTTLEGRTGQKGEKERRKKRGTNETKPVLLKSRGNVQKK